MSKHPVSEETIENGFKRMYPFSLIIYPISEKVSQDRVEPSAKLYFGLLLVDHDAAGKVAG
jgi:hypothetical protein